MGDVLGEGAPGHPELDAAAVEAIGHTRFDGGEPVEVWILLPVRFTLG